MPTEIWAAIIGALAAIIVALINSYRDELAALLSRTDRFSFMKGTWRCAWTILSPADASPPNHIDDQVTISKVRGARVRGEGATSDFGKWFLEGKASEFAVTLEYRGKGDMMNLVGVVILKKQTPLRLDGVWCQYSESGTLKSGSTAWEKIA